MSSFLSVQVPADWLARAGAGDAGAQRCLYEALARPVYTLLRRLVIRPAIAEELLHEVFIEVLGNLSAWQGTGSFAGWVRSIAVHKALAHLRSPWHARLLYASGEEAVDEAGHDRQHADEWQPDLERALNALPAIARSIVWLYDVEGYTHAEIALLYRQSTSFSKSQLARAHAALRAQLAPEDGVDPCPLPSRT